MAENHTQLANFIWSISNLLEFTGSTIGAPTPVAWISNTSNQAHVLAARLEERGLLRRRTSCLARLVQPRCKTSPSPGHLAPHDGSGDEKPRGAKFHRTPDSER